MGALKLPLKYLTAYVDKNISNFIFQYN
jgi:hypothetical protein